jgi:hypothetical protein
MEDTQSTDDELFYASDFEDDLNDLVEVENFLRSVDENKDEFRETVGFQETYFILNWVLDDDEEEDDETDVKHDLPTVMGMSTLTLHHQISRTSHHRYSRTYQFKRSRSIFISQ